MKATLPCLLVFVLLVGATARSLHAQQPPEHVNAYVFSVRAEQAEADGRLDEALNLYAESLRLYQETATAHPDWNPTVVQYRITTTANQVDRLQRARAAEAEKQREAEQAAILAEQEKAVAEARTVWLAEKAALESRITELDAERVRLQEAGRAVEAALKEARGGTEELEKIIAAREKRIKRLEEARDELRDETKGLAATVAERDQAIAELTERLATLPPPPISAEELAILHETVARREQELATLQGRLGDLQAEVDSLAEAAVVADQRRADSEADHAAALQAKQEAFDVLQAQLAARDEELDRLRRELAAAPAPLITEDGLRQLEADLVAQSAESATHLARLAEIEAELAGLRKTLQDREQAHVVAMEKAEASAAKRLARVEEKLKTAREEADGLRRSLDERTGTDAERSAALTELSAQRVALADELAIAVSTRDAFSRQAETLAAELGEARDALARQPAPLITPGELAALRDEFGRRETELADLAARLASCQAADAERQASITQLETQLATARQERDTAHANLTKYADCAAMYARFEKAEVENIIYRDAIVSLSNRIQSLTAQSSGMNTGLAVDARKWDVERRKLMDQIAALKETVDLNQAEIDKVRDLRATVRSLEKENRSLARRAKGPDSEAEAVLTLESRIAELEVEVESLRRIKP
ncbi:MAG TPA: hypothetical protein PKC67_02025 [Kiritimatiellia bacterium]|nr:hypothetical protein [Kiritimatiellia bacterium]HMP33102.1 hypothetical protein [Kiritimatiellia bacterium]